MAERIVPVRQVKVHMDCDLDGCTGEMLNDGSALLCSPPRYPHVCNVCGKKVTFGKRYPLLEFREVSNDRN